MRDIVPTPTPWVKGPYAGRPDPRAENGPVSWQTHRQKYWVDAVDGVDGRVDGVDARVADGR